MADIDLVRSVCLALKATTEDIKWEHHLVFSVGEKMFCMASLDAPFHLSFKVADEEFEEISSREGFKPAPYLARAKWVITDIAGLKKSELEAFLSASYQLVRGKLPKKVKQALKLD